MSMLVSTAGDSISEGLVKGARGRVMGLEGGGGGERGKREGEGVRGVRGLRLGREREDFERE